MECRDVIFLRELGAAWRWFVSNLDERARRITLKAGCEHVGWRLRPGVSVCADRLSGALHGCRAQEVDEARIADCCEVSVHLEETMAALAAGSDTRSAAERGRNLAEDLSANDYIAHRKWPRLLDPARTGATRSSPGEARAALMEIAAHVGFADRRT